MKEKRKIFFYINFGIFFGALFIMGMTFMLKPKQEISHEEKRKLASFPVWDLDSVAEGVYMKNIDKYVQDQFPYRDAFIAQAFALKEMRGWRNEELMVFNAPAKHNTTLNKDSSKATLAIADTAALKEETIEDNRGLVISNGRAMQLFGGNNKRAATYGNMVNAFYNELKDEGINVFSVVVPTAAEFYLPEKYKHLKEQEKRNINYIYETEVPGIKTVDAYSKIAAHKHEYVYFRTDHHWTGLGAYYAYTAFCEAAGFTAVPLADMTAKAKNKFYGTLYFHLDRNSVLGEHYDTVHYWKPPGKYTAVCYKKDNPSKEVKCNVIAEGAGGYSVFLGADYPLMKIETDVKNGRSIIVIKNSYGNPFTTFLVSHYEKIFVLDFRYYNGGIIDLLRENKVTDLLFINGTISANTPYTSSRIKHLMYGKKPVKTTKDSTAVKTVKDTLK